MRGWVMRGRRRGASGLGYGLLMGLVAVFTLAAVGATGDGVESVFCNVARHLADGVPDCAENAPPSLTLNSALYDGGVSVTRQDAGPFRIAVALRLRDDRTATEDITLTARVILGATADDTLAQIIGTGAEREVRFSLPQGSPATIQLALIATDDAVPAAEARLTLPLQLRPPAPDVVDVAAVLLVEPEPQPVVLNGIALEYANATLLTEPLPRGQIRPDPTQAISVATLLVEPLPRTGVGQGDGSPDAPDMIAIETLIATLLVEPKP